MDSCSEAEDEKTRSTLSNPAGHARTFKPGFAGWDAWPLGVFGHYLKLGRKWGSLALGPWSSPWFALSCYLRDLRLNEQNEWCGVGVKFDRWNRTHAHTHDLVVTPDPGVQVYATKVSG